MNEIKKMSCGNFFVLLGLIVAFMSCSEGLEGSLDDIKKEFNNSIENPVLVKPSINLDDTVETRIKYSEIHTDTNCGQLLWDIDAAGFYVDLDLSDCTINGTSFSGSSDSYGYDNNNNSIYRDGRQYIVSLTLPEAARDLSDFRADYYYDGYRGYRNLRSVSFSAAANLDRYSGTFSGCTNLTNFKMIGTGSLSVIEGGKALVRNSTELIAYPSVSGSITMNTIAAIGYSVFYRCTILTGANFPAASRIGEQAFSGCTSLTSVSFPRATNIDSYAFNGCDSLTSITIAGGISISSSQWSRFSSFRTYYLANTKPGRVERYTWNGSAWTGPVVQ
jgi:hypothetical protein